MLWASSLLYGMCHVVLSANRLVIGRHWTHPLRDWRALELEHSCRLACQRLVAQYRKPPRPAHGSFRRLVVSSVWRQLGDDGLAHAAMAESLRHAAKEFWLGAFRNGPVGSVCAADLRGLVVFALGLVGGISSPALCNTLRASPYATLPRPMVGPRSAHPG